MLSASPAKNKPVQLPAATGGAAAGAAGAIWAARAGDLAHWTWKRLVNRVDVWGAYQPLARRAERGNSWTAPAIKDRGQRALNPSTLVRHFRGRAPEHVIGLHSTSPANNSSWGALDIDKHEGGQADPDKNLAAALAWYDKLAALGFIPLLTESNGAGGYHLRVLFDEPVPTPRVFAFLHWLIADHAAFGLTAPPETFPKQARLAPGRFGNWLRLPGRHHSQDFWPRAWLGDRWLDGRDTVDFVLALGGSSPDLIPPDLPLPSPPAAAPPPAPRPAALAHPDDDGIEGRVRGYLARLPHLSAGQGRDDVAYRLACFLARDLRLSDGAALGWLTEWDAGNTPPKGEARLREILAGAHAYGTRPYGSGLGGPRPGGRRRHETCIHFQVRI
jgi:hypothetical protein